ncbi:formate/nitrite transporter FocA (FNT family) [Rhodococcus sp. 27YEA6]|jgi:formate/nitrite transporter FocA (FNT family)
MHRPTDLITRSPPTRSRSRCELMKVTAMTTTSEQMTIHALSQWINDHPTVTLVVLFVFAVLLVVLAVWMILR